METSKSNILGVFSRKVNIFFRIFCVTKIRNPGLDVALFVSIFESAHMTGQPILGLKPAKRGD
jgi:hypothetical protein